MGRKLFRLFPYYYQFVLAFLISLCFGALVFLWGNGYLDGSHMTSVYEATTIIKTLKEDKTLNYINDSITSGDISKARSRFNFFEDKVKKVNRIVRMDSYMPVEQNGKKLKESFSRLQTISNVNDAYRVLEEKAMNFSSYVKANKWRTLTRMSSIVQMRLTKNNGEFNGLGKTMSQVNKDIASMENITMSSILASNEKSEIMNRLKSLKVEIEILNNFSNERAGFLQNFKRYKNSFESWVTELGPELSLQKIEADRYGHYFLFLLVGLMLMSGILMAAGYIFQKKYEAEIGAQIEEKVLKINENNLIRTDELSSDFSLEFKQKFEQMKKYIHKRMMFGSIFQDSLPFPSVLLDSNLKVTWANQYFKEMWKLNSDDIQLDKISWDFLAKSTNLGQNDPVIEAHKNGIAGIYQIQVKTPEQKKFGPYEMYVSPIEYNGDISIQVYLYSLESLQDTIESQGRSIIGPITRTMDALLAGRFDSAFKEQIKSDYDVADINDIYEKICKHNEHATLQKEGLLSEIDRLEDESADMKKSLDDVMGLNKAAIEANLKVVKDLKIVRDKFIELAGVVDEYKELNANLRDSLHQSIQDYHISVRKNEGLFGSFSDALSAIPSVEKFKDEIKVIKNEMVSIKNKISQSIGKVVDSSKLDINSELKFKQAGAIERVNADLAALNDVIASIDKKMVFLDVQFSKTQMIFKEHKRRISENKVENEGIRQKDLLESFKGQNTYLSDLETRSQRIEDVVIDKLKSVYSGYKANTKVAYTVNKLIQDKDGFVEKSATETEV